jgi:hypothetical protein
MAKQKPVTKEYLLRKIFVFRSVLVGIDKATTQVNYDNFISACDAVIKDIRADIIKDR